MLANVADANDDSPEPLCRKVAELPTIVESNQPLSSGKVARDHDLRVSLRHTTLSAELWCREWGAEAPHRRWLRIARQSEKEDAAELGRRERSDATAANDSRAKALIPAQPTGLTGLLNVA